MQQTNLQTMKVILKRYFLCFATERHDIITKMSQSTDQAQLKINLMNSISNEDKHWINLKWKVNWKWIHTVQSVLHEPPVAAYEINWQAGSVSPRVLHDVPLQGGVRSQIPYSYCTVYKYCHGNISIACTNIIPYFLQLLIYSCWCVCNRWS